MKKQNKTPDRCGDDQGQDAKQPGRAINYVNIIKPSLMEVKSKIPSIVKAFFRALELHCGDATTFIRANALTDLYFFSNKSLSWYEGGRL